MCSSDLKPSIFDNPMYERGAENPGRSIVLIGQQFLNYWQYFTWQFGRDWSALAQRLLAVLFAGLGFLGARRHWRADRRSALAMTALVLTVTVALVFYLNFKWGFSQPYTGLEHEVRERDYFFIASFAVWGVWVGIGLAAIAETLRWRLAAAPLFVIALIPLVGNRLTASRAGETVARDYARDLLESVDPYALIITSGDNDTFPLWHAQEAQGIRRDVSVMVMTLANTNWYLTQLQRRPPVPYAGVPAPTQPWMSRYYLGTPGGGDSLPPYVIVDHPVAGDVGPIRVTLDPQVLKRPYLERAELAVLQIIKDQVGKRPIYFSRTVGIYADQFGLTGYLEGQGFARRLHGQPITPSDSIQPVGQLGYVNIPRSAALLFDVYHISGAARPRPRGWVDRPSEGILQTYGLMYTALSEAVRRTNPTLASRALVVADSIFKNTTLSFQPPGEVR